MKPEILESLLIDRDLGELSPDVSELLAAYLAQNPHAAQRTDELTATLRQARQAVAVTSKPGLAALATARFSPAVHAGAGTRWWHEGVRLAACLAVGVALGWFVHALNFRQNSALEAKVTVGSRLAMQADLPARSTPAAGFWSIDALAPAHTPQPAPRYRLHWTSPLAKPTVEEIP